MEDSYKQYKKDISSFPLLDEEREKILSDIINGNNSETEKRKAIDEIVLCNLRLVIKVAQDVHNSIKSFCRVPPSLMDVIEDGNVGLIKAAENFNSDKGRFSTYAYRVIKSCIMRKHVQSSNFIKLPPAHYKLIAEVKKIRDKYGDDISDEIIIEETGINKQQLENIKSSEVILVSSIEDFFNTDTPEESSNLLDVYVSGEDTITDLMIDEEGNKYVRAKLSELDEREQYILKMHFFEELPISSQIIIDTLGITKQRIHIIYKEAMAKLKKIIMLDLRTKDVSVSDNLSEKYKK